MFIDTVHNTQLKADNGGNAGLHCHRGKFVPESDQNHGDAILISDENINDLFVYRFISHAKAKRGKYRIRSDLHR
jgi:GTPase involved in cell partitioning and DNA repair